MNFLKHFVVLAAAVLFVLCGQSEAGIESAVNSITSGASTFARLFRGAVVEGEGHESYYDTRNYIRQQAALAPQSQANQILLEGFLQVTDFIKSGANLCYMSLREANNSLATASPEAVVQIIETAFAKTNMEIVGGGLASYTALGGVKEMSNQAVQQGLNEANDVLTKSGGVGFDGYAASKDLAIQGVRSGKDAPVQALLAAYRGVQSTEQALFNMLKKVVRMSYDALSALPLQLGEISQNNILKDSAAAQSPKCQNAIKSVEQSTARALSLSASENKTRAIQFVRSGFIEALKTIALAGQSAYRSINEAKVLPTKELALDRVNEGIADAKDKCFFAISIAQLAIGGAGHIIGSEIKEQIREAIIMIENSRTILLKALDNSLLLMVQGIENHAAETAFLAGSDGTATSGFSAYAEISKATEFLMSIILSSSN